MLTLKSKIFNVGHLKKEKYHSAQKQFLNIGIKKATLKKASWKKKKILDLEFCVNVS